MNIECLHILLGGPAEQKNISSRTISFTLEEPVEKLYGFFEFYVFMCIGVLWVKSFKCVFTVMILNFSVKVALEAETGFS